MLKKSTILIAIACLLFSFKSDDVMPRLSISANHRYFMAGALKKPMPTVIRL
jgi:hypothetical protein